MWGEKSQIKVRAAIFHNSAPAEVECWPGWPLHLPTSLPLVTMCTLHKKEWGLSLLTENRSQLADILDCLSGMISNFATGSLSSLFYHCFQIWYKDCLKYENRMRLLGTPFVPPSPHHLALFRHYKTSVPKRISQTSVTKASESESFIDELISGFMMEFHHF